MSGLQVGEPSGIDAATATAVHAFLRRLEGRYAVRESFLFGSRARGEGGADSDADLAVVIEGPVGDRGHAAREMAGIAFDVLLETGILVEALPLWTDEFDRFDPDIGPSVIGSIKRDGIRV